MKSHGNDSFTKQKKLNLPDGSRKMIESKIIAQ